jgi:hypothetical protein
MITAMVGLAIGLSVAATMMAVMALCVAGWGIAEIRGYKMSTHNVQFVSAEDLAKERAADEALNRVYEDSQVRGLNDQMGMERDEQ